MKRILPVFIFLHFYACVIQAQNPVLIPDTLSGTTFNLNLAPDSVSFLPGVYTHTIGVNGPILGPTLIFNEGDSVTLNVTNDIGDTTTVHWHGLHVAPHNDGGPHMHIMNGDTWSPSFKVRDVAGTYWYHPHLHMRTAEHVTRGAAGFIIIRDAAEAALALPRTYGVDDFPLVFQSRGFDSIGEFRVMTPYDTLMLVNATRDAQLNVPAQVVRLRLLNGSTERVYRYGLSNNQNFYLIGSDGGLLNAPVTLTRLDLAPGERAEILVDFGGMNGQNIDLMSYASEFPNGIYGATNPARMGPGVIPNYASNPLNGADFNLMNLNIVAATSGAITTIPSSLVTVTPIPSGNAVRTRLFSFNPVVMGPNGMLNGPFTINNMSYSLHMPPDTCWLNETEIWEVNNATAIAHPFHVHGLQFYVLDVDGVSPPPSLQGRKDVVLLPGGNSISHIIMKFEDFVDADIPFMYHCHMLSHEDDGMMGQYIVLDPNPVGMPNTAGESVQFRLWPNPSGRIFNIEIPDYPGGDCILTISDELGRMLKEEILFLAPGGRAQIESELPDGLYLLNLKTQSGTFLSKLRIQN